MHTVTIHHTDIPITFAATTCADLIIHLREWLTHNSNLIGSGITIYECDGDFVTVLERHGRWHIKWGNEVIVATTWQKAKKIFVQVVGQNIRYKVEVK